MQIRQCKNYEEVSRLAADLIAAQISAKPDSVLGLATGSSPIGTYRYLIEKYNSGALDFSAVTAVNLDEYVGLAPEHRQSYRFFMNDNLFDHININKNRTFVPNGLAENTDAECAAYDARIEAVGGIDLQLLGIGGNGHIGFNEPAVALDSATHIVTLKEETRKANARFFSSIDEVPTRAITMGMKSILSAKKILLIANGKAKADIIRKALYGPVTTDVPASLLQLHPDVTVLFTETEE